MNEARHTQAPWYLGCCTGDETQILADEPREDDISDVWVVATVNGCMGRESKANARLIAKALELLEAVEILAAHAAADTLNDCQGDEGNVYDTNRLHDPRELEYRVIKTRALLGSLKDGK